jgi:ATP-dependent Clp protease ATP-binding subunit ClpC
MGFDTAVDGTRDYEKLKERILEETKRAFKPEFLNRLTDIVIFQQLGKEHMNRIVELELSKVTKRLVDLEITLQISEEARNYLVEHGWDEKYGARPLRRAVERHLEDPLAEIVLRGELRKGEPILVGASPEGLTFIQPEVPKEAVKEKGDTIFSCPLDTNLRIWRHRFLHVKDGRHRWRPYTTVVTCRDVTCHVRSTPKNRTRVR